MSQIIDRRQNGKNKSAINRQRFIKRYRNQLKKAVAQVIGKRSIRDIDKGEEISISTKDISEHVFHHKSGGVEEHVCPGNKEFLPGDKIERPSSSADKKGVGDSASNNGQGEDDFTFQLSREEFLDLYFDDLALPELTRKQLAKITENKFVRAGYTTTGTPNNINVIRTMKQALGRRVAFSSIYRVRLAEAEKELENLVATDINQIHQQKIDELKTSIEVLKKKINAIAFIDDIDLRYNTRVKQQIPSTQAVMFCIMDVSGSMDEIKKEIAKRFFILLFLFLKRNYTNIELIFIRHHTCAKEVLEEEFFYSRETGGTVVSSALELAKQIATKRYPSSSWNIYMAQASDGDNWNADSPYCQELLANSILPLVQYYAYVEIMPRHHQSLWEGYKLIQSKFPNFAMQEIQAISDIYPVFRELFKRSES